MNSSIEPRLSILTHEVSVPWAQEFLLRLVNVDPSKPDELGAFLRRYWDWFKTNLGPLNDVLFRQTDKGRSARRIDSGLAVGAVIFSARFREFGGIFMLGEILRSVWKKPTTLEREISLLSFLYDLAQLECSMENPPARVFNGPLAMILLRAYHLADRMRRCANSECTVTPYFIAQRRSQKYCNEVCAAPSQRQFKANWWIDHGDEWRKQRKKKAKKRAQKRRRKRD